MCLLSKTIQLNRSNSCAKLLLRQLHRIDFSRNLFLPQSNLSFGAIAAAAAPSITQLSLNSNKKIVSISTGSSFLRSVSMDSSSSEQAKLPVNRRVLSIQSHVVHGYVGNKSATFPLQVSFFFVFTIQVHIHLRMRHTVCQFNNQCLFILIEMLLMNIFVICMKVCLVKRVCSTF